VKFDEMVRLAGNFFFFFFFFLIFIILSEREDVAQPALKRTFDLSLVFFPLSFFCFYALFFFFLFLI
jgi:hypothetical protein